MTNYDEHQHEHEHYHEHQDKHQHEHEHYHEHGDEYYDEHGDEHSEPPPSEALLSQAVALMEVDAADFFDKLRYVADNCEVDTDELLYALRQCC